MVSVFRAAFIRRYIRDGRPSIGHECLSALLAEERCDWVWTTNFDDLVERAERPDASRRLSQIGPESVSRLDKVHELSPVLVKLHGDYRYDALQNTTSELLGLDEKLRRYLEEQMRDQGLIVVWQPERKMPDLVRRAPFKSNVSRTPFNG